MYKYIFGPIQSRRFGLSLGIDLSPQDKSCNFDCLYCELKPAKVTKNINNPPDAKSVLVEIKEALIEYPDVDVITITANGEPTLYPFLDTLIDDINIIKVDKKLLILSNASTIIDLNIQKILNKIDIVKLSLDCARSKCFKKIDRPIANLSIDDIIKNLITFSNDFQNTLILEILVVEGINDKVDEFKALKKAIDKINPNRIDLGTIDRPPAYNVKGVSIEKLKQLRDYLGNHNVSIIHKDKPKVKVDFSKEEIIATLKRRPQSEADVEYLFSEKSKENLALLIFEKKITKKDIAGVIFYTLL